MTLDEAKAMLEAWRAWDSASADPPPDQPLDIGGALLAIIDHLLQSQDAVLAACHPGCGWNGEVTVADGWWTCPQCGKRQSWTEHSDGDVTP